MRRSLLPEFDRRAARGLFVVVVVLSLAIAVAACGGSSGSSSTAAETESTEAESNVSEEGTGAESEGSETSLTAAKEVIAPYIGQPSSFPAAEPLKEVPKGATVMYPNCGTPVCNLQWEYLVQAAKTMGITVKQVKAGPDAKSVASGYETIVTEDPDAVIAAGQNIELWKPQLEELQANGVKIVTSGITGTEPFGIKGVLSGEAQNLKVGELLANYVAAEMSDEANVAIYRVPELPFSPEVTAKFEEELEVVCPKCSVRVVDISIETLGSTSANAVVSDLQANPETTVAVFSIDEIEGGLPAAMQAAGIEVETLGYAPTPQTLQYMKEGKVTAGLGYDIGLAVWELLDMAAREIVGQPLSGPEAEGLSVNQFLTQEDITFDPSKGWIAYPDFEERFKKLWGVE